MTHALEELKSFLREMFQFDEHDLDFGIYKMLRLNRRYDVNHDAQLGELKLPVEFVTAGDFDRARTGTEGWSSNRVVWPGEVDYDNSLPW